MFVIPLIGLLALLCFAWLELKNAFQNRRWFVLLFALLCLALALSIFPRSITFPPAPDFPLFVYIPDLLLVVEMVLLLSTGLFVLGVKSIHLLRNGQGGLVFFVLALVLLLPLGQLAYPLWGTAQPEGTVTLPQDGLLIGNTVFSSVADVIWFVAHGLAPYFTLGGLVLALVDKPPNAQSIRVVQKFGILTLLLLVLNIAVIVVWDVNRWIGGHVWIFDPTVGIWPLFRGQWIGALIANVLILVLSFTVMLIALLRSYTTSPNAENNIGQQTA